MVFGYVFICVYFISKNIIIINIRKLIDRNGIFSLSIIFYYII